MNDLSIRRAIAADAAPLTALAMRAKAHWGYSEEFLELCRDDIAITPAFIAAGHVFAGERDGALVGFFGLSAAAGEPELVHLYVEPTAIGTGAGKLLWKRAVEEAERLSWGHFKIVSDPNAFPFYEKMGAIPMGEIESPVKKDRKIPWLYFLLSNPSQDVINAVGFHLAGMVLSFGKAHLPRLVAFVPLTLEKHVLGLPNLIAALDDEYFTRLLAHPDYLVRWSALDCIKYSSPINPERFAKTLAWVETRLRDERPELAAYARYIVEDYHLDQAVYLKKTSELRKKMSEHRKRDVLTVRHLALEFPLAKRGKTYTRPDLDRFIEETLKARGGIVKAN